VLFSSPWFFAFVACVLGVLALPLSTRAKKRFLALASCFFYAFWDWHYLFLLLAISVVDYVCAKRIHARTPRQRLWLIASIASNLGILAYFKYTNFFLENVNAVLASSGVHIRHLDILLPAGVSFYTFKTMSYVIDVYRGELEPVDSWLDYTTFITFFPELIAGPIVRASVLIPQLTRAIRPTRERLAAGASLFLVGFTKKTWGDRLGILITPVFAHPTWFDAKTLWAATLGYTLQIYCDFAGYSDMAIGTAKAIGYELPENFRMPYLSANITEFWRRWHMTLSFWLRDYLYISLGGNRRGRGRTYLNLLLTMVLGGLWHGASWNFVLWGTLHGVALALHRFAKERTKGRVFLPQPLASLVTFTFVSLCWIPFRCTTFGATWAMLRGLAGLGNSDNTWVSIQLAGIGALVAFGHAAGVVLEAVARGTPVPWASKLLGFLGIEVVADRVSGIHARLSLSRLPAATLVLTWVVLAYLFTPTLTSPFIYFQF
jgi:alginate O-acetyltransferase complex protein AlgI